MQYASAALVAALFITVGVALPAVAGQDSPGGARQKTPAASTQPAATDGSTAPMSGFLFKSLVHEGKTYKYVVYVPRGYDAAKSWPAILFLHGSGECGSDGAKMLTQGIGSSILRQADRWPCIVIFPQKPDQKAQWEAYDAMLMAMLAATQREYTIDAERVALTGLSQGGHGVWALGAAHPDVWSALVPICAYSEPQRPAALAERIKALPIWCFHGAEDDVVPPERSKEVIAALEAAGGKPKLTIFPKVNHGSWDKAYAEPELPGWIFSQKRK